VVDRAPAARARYHTGKTYQYDAADDPPTRTRGWPLARRHHQLTIRPVHCLAATKDHRHWHVEHVAAPGHRPDGGLRIIVERATNLEQALREGVVRDRGVGPDRFHQFILRDEFPVVYDQVSEDVEALGSEGERPDRSGAGIQSRDRGRNPRIDSGPDDMHPPPILGLSPKS
jgi:hypothetical protein